MPGYQQNSLPVAIKWPLTWAIFLAEGDCRASVPFGYLPFRDRWKAGKASFIRVLTAVLAELEVEWARWTKQRTCLDFITWLARVGYNANPQEWDAWEKNVRSVYCSLTGEDRIPLPP